MTMQELHDVKQSGSTDINDYMDAMPPDDRYNWCEADQCHCLGCANNSGGLLAAGFTKADWQAWVDENPRPQEDE